MHLHPGRHRHLPHSGPTLAGAGPDDINQVDFRRRITFADLAQHYIEHELGEQTESVSPKAHTTIGAFQALSSLSQKRLSPQLVRTYQRGALMQNRAN
jgi:hypothetical protein